MCSAIYFSTIMLPNNNLFWKAYYAATHFMPTLTKRHQTHSGEMFTVRARLVQLFNVSGYKISIQTQNLQCKFVKYSNKRE